MSDIDRRLFLTALATAAANLPAAPALAQPARPKQPAETPRKGGNFGFEDVIKRAREISEAPFDATIPPLPPQLANQSWDAWREIRFRPDKALLANSPSRFRLQLFHLGHLFKKPVTINTVRDRIATPMP